MPLTSTHTSASWSGPGVHLHSRAGSRGPGQRGKSAEGKFHRVGGPGCTEMSDKSYARGVSLAVGALAVGNLASYVFIRDNGGQFGVTLVDPNQRHRNPERTPGHLWHSCLHFSSPSSPPPLPSSLRLASSTPSLLLPAVHIWIQLGTTGFL